MVTTAEYGLGEFAFPRGWFMVAEASELDDGPIGARFFAKDFVIYRGQSGRVVMLDAYCPHMGTHLAKNTTSYTVRDGEHVEGDSIRCPYHAWRFGPDGKCDQIPYATRIPAAARLNSYPVVERAGAIFMWHDPEGLEPDFDLPEFPQWDDPAWVRWKFDHLGTLPVHQQEVLDNMADMPHLGPVHGAPVVYFENEFRGPVCIQRQGGRSRTLANDEGILETATWYTGPGILLSNMTGVVEALIFIANPPVDDGTTHVWHGLLVKSPNALATETDVDYARSCQAAHLTAFAQDFEIWANKRPALSILQIPEDGPFAKNRVWLSQFYNPRSRVPEILGRVEGLHGAGRMPRSMPEKAA